jgi:hypothetical protein
VTPKLSLEADQESSMLVAVRDETDMFPGAVGGWLSKQADVEAVTAARPERFPAAS